MSVKAFKENTEIEILTPKYDIYLRKTKSSYEIDVFASKEKDPDEAYIGGQIFDESQSMIDCLNNHDVSKEDIAKIKKIWDMD